MNQTIEKTTDETVIVGMEHEKKEHALDMARDAKNTVAGGVSSLFESTTSHAKDPDHPAGTATADGKAHPLGGEQPAPEEAAPAEPKYILSISENVVEKISSLAARKVGGIVDMKGNVFSLIQETFGGNAKSKGVNASVVDNGDAHVELSIILEYGKSAVEVFEGLKKVISEDIGHMTGLHIARLTVNVVDVMDEHEIAEKRRKESEAAASSSATAPMGM